MINKDVSFSNSIKLVIKSLKEAYREQENKKKTSRKFNYILSKQYPRTSDAQAQEWPAKKYYLPFKNKRVRQKNPRSHTDHSFLSDSSEDTLLTRKVTSVNKFEITKSIKHRLFKESIKPRKVMKEDFVPQNVNEGKSVNVDVNKLESYRSNVSNEGTFTELTKLSDQLFENKEMLSKPNSGRKLPSPSYQISLDNSTKMIFITPSPKMLDNLGSLLSSHYVSKDSLSGNLDSARGFDYKVDYATLIAKLKQLNIVQNEEDRE